MIGPSTKPKERRLVPHPDDEADVRAGLDEAKRGDVLSPEEFEEYIRSLIGDDASKK
jgi:predicted transcriptional regulator